MFFLPGASTKTWTLTLTRKVLLSPTFYVFDTTFDAQLFQIFSTTAKAKSRLG